MAGVIKLKILRFDYTHRRRQCEDGTERDLKMLALKTDKLRNASSPRSWKKGTDSLPGGVTLSFQPSDTGFRLLASRAMRNTFLLF